jgi:hypothetical protein
MMTKKRPIHRWQPGNTPWNKGLKGLDAGWDDARRQRASDRQRERFMANPAKYHILTRSGPQPHTWITGPDPQVKQHRLRWNRSRAQARFWSQDWTISWEDYLDLLKTAAGEWSRDSDALNLVRLDTEEGWHIWNVKLMRRKDAMRRPTEGKKRIRPPGQGAKARGENWRRGGHTKNDR